MGLEQEMEKVGTIPIVPTFSISTREKKESRLSVVTVSLLCCLSYSCLRNLVTEVPVREALQELRMVLQELRDRVRLSLCQVASAYRFTESIVDGV